MQAGSTRRVSIFRCSVPLRTFPSREGAERGVAWAASKGSRGEGGSDLGPRVLHDSLPNGPAMWEASSPHISRRSASRGRERVASVGRSGNPTVGSENEPAPRFSRGPSTHVATEDNRYPTTLATVVSCVGQPPPVGEGSVAEMIEHRPHAVSGIDTERLLDLRPTPQLRHPRLRRSPGEIRSSRARRGSP